MSGSGGSGPEIVLTAAGEIQFLGDKLETLRALSLGLSVTDTEITVDTTIDDLEEADFHGYDRQLLDDFGTPYLTDAKVALTETMVHSWTDEGEDPANLIYCWFAIDDSEHILFGGRFPDAPRHMDRVGAFLGMQIRFREMNQTICDSFSGE